MNHWWMVPLHGDVLAIFDWISIWTSSNISRNGRSAPSDSFSAFSELNHFFQVFVPEKRQILHVATFDLRFGVWLPLFWGFKMHLEAI